MEKGNHSSDEVIKILLNEMKDGIFKDQRRLPTEAKLADMLGVSRTMLRDSLAEIEREGYISRKQGVGTIINQHVFKVVTRVDLEYEFLEMVEQTGAAPGVAFYGVDTGFADEQIADRLCIAIQTPILRVRKLVTADTKPAILVDDFISFKIIKDYSYQKSELEEPIFKFLKKYCDVDVYMDLTVIKPIVADEKLAEIFDINKGSPLLYMDEVGYDFDGNPILYSQEYYADGIFEHTVLRKKI